MKIRLELNEIEEALRDFAIKKLEKQGFNGDEIDNESLFTYSEFFDFDEREVDGMDYCLLALKDKCPVQESLKMAKSE